MREPELSCLCWWHSCVLSQRDLWGSLSWAVCVDDIAVCCLRETYGGAWAELFVLMTSLCVVSERLMREPELSCLCWWHSCVLSQRDLCGSLSWAVCVDDIAVCCLRETYGGAWVELFVLMTSLCVVSERLMGEPELSCLCWWHSCVLSQRDLCGSLSWAVCQSQCNTVCKGTMPSLISGSVRWRLWGWVYSSRLCVPSLSCNVCNSEYMPMCGDGLTYP